MNAPTYFYPNYKRAILHTADGTPSTGPTLTLEGQMQQLLDGVHVTLSQHAGKTDPPMTGPIAEQTTRPYVRNALFVSAATYPKLFKDAVPKGATAEGLAWYYWHQAQRIFTFYGR